MFLLISTGSHKYDFSNRVNVMMTCKVKDHAAAVEVGLLLHVLLHRCLWSLEIIRCTTTVKLYACGTRSICDTYGGEEKCGKPEGRGSLGKCRPRWQDNMKLDSLICMETKVLCLTLNKPVDLTLN